MSFKKMIFVLTISISSVFLLMFGTSYAYYVSDAGTNLSVTTGDFDANVAVVFSESEYISMNAGIPIMENEVETKASGIFFSLIPDATILDGYEASATISLTDISIDDELRVDDFKYLFTCGKEAKETEDYTEGFYIKSGTGDDFTNEVLNSDNLVINTIRLDSSNNFYCRLYVYLLETGYVQNHLMNKNFSAKIKVDSRFRK